MDMVDPDPDSDPDPQHCFFQCLQLKRRSHEKGVGKGGIEDVVGFSAFRIKRFLITRIYRCHLFEEKIISPSRKGKPAELVLVLEICPLMFNIYS